MKRLITVIAALFLLISGRTSAQAQGSDHGGADHMHGGVGFHNTSAPIGIRWWFTGQKVALDAGVGFGSDPAPLYADEKVTNWTIDFGVPFVVRSWERVHVLLRPGFNYHSQQVVITSPPTAFNTDDETSFGLSLELEGEVFLADNVSFSASQGIEFNSLNPVGPGDSITSFNTLGRNFTEVGFHVYFLGGHQ
jgi:hypothetical protein